MSDKPPDPRWAPGTLYMRPGDPRNRCAVLTMEPFRAKYGPIAEVFGDNEEERRATAQLFATSKELYVYLRLLIDNYQKASRHAIVATTTLDQIREDEKQLLETIRLAENTLLKALTPGMK